MRNSRMVGVPCPLRRESFCAPAMQVSVARRPPVIALGDPALRRLTLRPRRAMYQGEPPNTVTVAIARELAGRVWNALQVTVPKRN